MKKVFQAITVAVILTLALTACGASSTPAPTLAPQVINTPVKQPENAVPTVASSELCTNLYWPIKDASRWAYSSTGSAFGPYEFGMKLRDLRADGFTVSASFKKEANRQDWLCTNDGMVPYSMIGNNAINILAIRTLENVSLTNIAGTYLPKNIVPGQVWTLEYLMTGEQEDQGVMYPASGHAKYQFTAGQTETVTVPAGTYEAMPITIRNVILIVIAGANGQEEIGVDSTYTYWFAPNVGWVKASGSGTLGGQEFFETIELIGFDPN